MEETLGRRGAMKVIASAAAAMTVGAASAAAGDKKNVSIVGGWQRKDVGYEKHVPEVSVKRTGETAEVTLHVKHPQTAGHHISTLKMYTADRLEITECNLDPEESVPKVTFYLNVKKGKVLIATSDCNLHGIWMKEIKV